MVYRKVIVSTLNEGISSLAYEKMVSNLLLGQIWWLSEISNSCPIVFFILIFYQRTNELRRVIRSIAAKLVLQGTYVLDLQSQLIRYYADPLLFRVSSTIGVEWLRQIDKTPETGRLHLLSFFMCGFSRCVTSTLCWSWHRRNAQICR